MIKYISYIIILAFISPNDLERHGAEIEEQFKGMLIEDEYDNC